ncbi:unnamed protein product [Effrenium voratum]|uniref:Calmodulin n=1 Tax=Effrenium voratum TaxID=2562239 RepID=A0AA36NDH1_9DINO|nr:unnamed protein product [Effrenium voratum]CAJ1429430.1 unnamed protein product [Effrenium voratum]
MSKLATTTTRWLPPGWSVHKDKCGRTYYANSDTGKVQWLPPPTVQKTASEVRTLIIQHNFKAADRDNSGVINKSELGLMMRRINPEMTAKEVEDMHKAMDSDLDGKVSFSEFHDWILADAQRGLAEKLTHLMSSPAGGVHATFRIWDMDSNGKLSRHELAEVLQKSLPHISQVQLEGIFDELDKDKTGQVTVSEFMGFLYGSGAATSFSKASVERRPGWEEAPDSDAARKMGATPTAPALAERRPPAPAR